MHIGFRRADVRALVDQLARQADRQVCRQLQMRKVEFLHHLVRRQLPGERRQEIALLVKLLLQRRQQLLRDARYTTGWIADIVRKIVASDRVEEAAIYG